MPNERRRVDGEGTRTDEKVGGRSTRVTRVIDGDTVDTTKLDRVRLIGVDTPEEGRCYEAAATRFTRERIGRPGRPLRARGRAHRPLRAHARLPLRRRPHAQRGARTGGLRRGPNDRAQRPLREIGSRPPSVGPAEQKRGDGVRASDASLHLARRDASGVGEGERKRKAFPPRRPTSTAQTSAGRCAWAEATPTDSTPTATEWGVSNGEPNPRSVRGRGQASADANDRGLPTLRGTGPVARPQ